MQDRMLFLISAPRSGSTLLQRMLGSHREIFTHPEPHLITPLAFLGYYDTVDKAPYDHINAAEAMRTFVAGLPHGEGDYLDALRAYADTLYQRMLEPSGQRYFLDKTPAYALVLDFLTKLYPRAKYVVLTRHPLAVMSSYANSFFYGDWHAAHDFNPIVNRYVPAIAELLRTRPVDLAHVQYEQLVREPAGELARIFAYLNIEHDPEAVHYGQRFEAKAEGMGDPIGVGSHEKPVGSSVSKWVHELRSDPDKHALAREIVDRLDPRDCELWGYEKSQLFAPLHDSEETQAKPPKIRPELNSYVMQRRILLALKKDIHRRPLGRLVKRVRYYCDVLLRE